MCRRIVIDCQWGDGDNPGMFDPDQNYDALTDFAENVLWKELSGMFDGQMTIRVEPLPRG